jgi:hypothetical protein
MKYSLVIREWDNEENGVFIIDDKGNDVVKIYEEPVYNDEQPFVPHFGEFARRLLKLMNEYL